MSVELVTNNPVITSFLTSIAANISCDLVKFVKKSLLPHQMKNLTLWFQAWNPSLDDLEKIKANESLVRTFSVLFEKVQNEVFEEKIAQWGNIASNIFMMNKVDYGQEMHFVHIFMNMDLAVLAFLFDIKRRSFIEYNEIFPKDFPKKRNETIEANYYKHMNALTLGLAIMIDQKFELTSIGNAYLEFVSERLK